MLYYDGITTSPSCSMLSPVNATCVVHPYRCCRLCNLARSLRTKSHRILHPTRSSPSEREASCQAWLLTSTNAWLQNSSTQHSPTPDRQAFMSVANTCGGQNQTTMRPNGPPCPPSS